MALTNKYLLFDFDHGAFMNEHAQYVASRDIQKGAVYTDETAKAFGLDPEDETKYLQVPLTQEFVDALPFELADTAPDVPHSKSMDTQAAMEGDFVVLTDMGFYDEKYNSLNNTSRPKVRGFELDCANLYNADILKELGTEGIVDAEENGVQPIIVPVSGVQQERLAQLPQFSPEKEPHGFFMKPIGETEKEEMPDLGTALDELQEEAKAQNADLPFSV